MRVAKLAKIQRSVNNLTESFRGVNLNAFQSLKRAISHIESARESEKKRVASRANKKGQTVNFRELLGI